MLRKQRGAIALAFLGIVISPVKAETVFLARPAETGGLVSRIGDIEGAARVAVSELGGRVVVLTDSGRLWEWQHGEHPTWTLVEGAERITSVASGSSHTIARRDDGAVLTWGINTEGQLGDGSLRSSSRAVAVELAARQVAAGPNYSMVLDIEGSVWVWGGNWQGIAPGKTERTLTHPIRVEGLPAIESIVVRGNQPFALDHQETVWTWGKFLETDDRDTPRMVDTGKADSPMALLAQELRQAQEISAVTLTGKRWWPGIGQPNRMVRSGEDSVTIGDTSVELPGWRPRIAAAAGWALVWITGAASPENSFSDLSALESGVPLAREPAAQIDARAPVVFSSIAAGAFHSLAVHNNGTAWSWGANESGQLGTREYVQYPTPVPSFAGVAVIRWWLSPHRRLEDRRYSVGLGCERSRPTGTGSECQLAIRTCPSDFARQCQARRER